MISAHVFTDEPSQGFEEAEFAVENDIKNCGLRDLWRKNVGSLSKEDVANMHRRTKKSCRIHLYSDEVGMILGNSNSLAFYFETIGKREARFT
jgi:hypothetical protein